MLKQGVLCLFYYIAPPGTKSRTAVFIKAIPTGIKISVQHNTMPSTNNTSAIGTLIKSQIDADKTTPDNLNAIPSTNVKINNPIKKLIIIISLRFSVCFHEMLIHSSDQVFCYIPDLCLFFPPIDISEFSFQCSYEISFFLIFHFHTS